ncbi:MAG: lysylphosphatidylglycerol synthase transmembrane domain-containing protein [Candidatus Pacearchaeota archaeon]
MRKKIISAVSLFVGLVIFGFILWKFGLDSFEEIVKNANPIYLLPFVAFALVSVSLQAFKLRLITKAHGYKMSFLKSLRYVLVGSAVANSTPSAKVGGEPVKAYMMKKEEGIPLKSGGSSVIIEKFVELVGVGLMAILTFILVFFVPKISFSLKVSLLVAIFFFFAIIFLIYSSTVRGKGPFFSLFNLFGFYKFKKFKRSKRFLKNVDRNMKIFFKLHKPRFWLALIIYFGFLASQIIEYKFILLSLGVDASFFELLLALVVFWIAGMIPVPGGIGFQEAGHSGLFSLLRGSAGLGLVFSLIIRFRYLIIIGIGFTILSHFGGKEILKKFENNNNS